MGGRPATGQVLKPGKWQRSFALRVWAYGKREYITVGRPEDGWTTRRAERELQIVLRDIDLGVWKPPRPEPARTEKDRLFHEFASEWFAAKRPELAANTARSYRNDLTKHLLPFFAEHTLAQITVSEVDRYRQERVHEAARLTAAAREGKTRTVVVVDGRGRSYQRSERSLSNRSINMHLFLLAQILEVAVEHGLIAANPAKGKRTLIAPGLVNRLADFGRCGAQLRDHRVGQRQRQRNDLVIDEPSIVHRRGEAVKILLGRPIGELRLQVRPRVLALIVHQSVA